MNKHLALIVVLLTWNVSLVFGVTATVERGNIFILGESGKRVQLTSTGLDSEPACAPDGALIVFVRKSLAKPIEAGTGKESANELWVIDPFGGKARKIVSGHASDDMKQVLAGLSSPVFSNDSKKVYFLSAAWVTSNAVHSVNLTTRRIEFIAAGNSLEVVRSKKYSGHLIIQQHRYWIAGGAYDWYWLFDPSGREVGAIGEEPALMSFREMGADQSG